MEASSLYGVSLFGVRLIDSHLRQENLPETFRCGMCLMKRAISLSAQDEVDSEGWFHSLCLLR